MLAASIIAMGFCIVRDARRLRPAARLRANWIFQAAPVAAGPGNSRGAPPNHARTLRIAGVGRCLGRISSALAVAPGDHPPDRTRLIRISRGGGLLAGTAKIPFTCSYLPGKSNVNVSFWLYILVVFQAIALATKWEISAFDDPRKVAKMLIALCVAVAVLRWRTSSEAASNVAELRYEEVPVSELQQLRLDAPPREEAATLRQ